MPPKTTLPRSWLLFALPVLVSACTDRSPKSAASATQQVAASSPGNANAIQIPTSSVTPIAEAAPNQNPPPLDFNCSPTLTAEQCAQAKASLARDGEALAAELSANSEQLEARRSEIESWMPDPVDLAKKACAEQRSTLAGLKRRQQPAPGEFVFPADAAKLPDLIEKTERYLSSRCP